MPAIVFGCALVLCLLSSISSGALPVKVACVGDSITEGSGLSNPGVESYPAKLGRLLGTNYVVRNYGVSGRTLLKQGDFPFWKETSFTNSHEWLPDLVIIQLGTNDGKPYNWRYGTNFVSDYEELVASYAGLTNSPRVMVCTPCPVYGKGVYDINPGLVATNIAPRVRDIAGRLNLDLIDLQTRLAGHPELFPDTVHPSTKGTTVLAAVIFSSLPGAPEPSPEEALGVGRSAANRPVLSWSGESRALVPEQTSALRGTNTAWTVSEAVIYFDGAQVRQTNAPGPARFYRLWLP